MSFKVVVILGSILLSSLLPTVYAQSSSSVMPATVPIPMTGARPIPPDVLRARSPFNLSMCGKWKFKLTNGQIVNGRFEPSVVQAYGVDASGYELANQPQNAFDGSTRTRWCASSESFPQWLSADLRRVTRVNGVSLTWERKNELYRCSVEGSTNGTYWTKLADATAEPGIGDGPLAVTPSDVRFVRVTVTGSQGGWASLREVNIHVLSGGRDVVWHPKADMTVPSSANAFTQNDFDDRRWDSIPVPSNWEVLGYSLPTYRVVDESVGLYRRWVFVPESFVGKKIYWHFDGALDGTEIFINGKKAGYHESGYTGFEVDITGLVKPGARNLFVLRISKTTPSSDCETGDYQCLGGVYRDTSLIAVPQTHIHDITVRTHLVSDYRDANLSANILVCGKPGNRVSLVGSVVGTDGKALAVRLSGTATVSAKGSVMVSLHAFVKSPRLWSAEKPNLYYLVARLSQNGREAEGVEQRFGFREVEIKNNVVLWNGRPIKCTGVCRHDFWPSKGFALTDVEWNKDLTLMKAANINAIRTSHYNHAARFLELCDERGMYILDEVPFCWIGDKVSDPKFAPALLERAEETIQRDKNRACVLAWSLGNENSVGSNTQKVRDLVERLDPTRPAFASTASPGDMRGQDFYDMHYPAPKDVDWYVAHNSRRAPAVFTENPHIFYQLETQQYDPGASDLWSEALIKIWDKLWKDPTILGSFIWEWQNQGIADKNKDRTTEFWYGTDHLRQENNKGVVDGYRNLKPEWWIVKQVYTKIAIQARTVTPVDGVCRVNVINRYSFTNLDELPCTWTALKGGQIIKSGTLRINAEPGRRVEAAFPAPSGMTALRLVFLRPDKTSAAEALLGVPAAPCPMPSVRFTPGGGPLTVSNDGTTLTAASALQHLQFDDKTGQLIVWNVGGRKVLVGGPVLNLGEAKAGSAVGYLSTAQPPVVDGVTVHDGPNVDGSTQIEVTGAVHREPGGALLGSVSYLYELEPNAEMKVSWKLDWGGGDSHLWESGIKLSLPAGYDHMTWWRDSYFSVYPRGHMGEPIGSCSARDVSFRASKRSLHWMTLSDVTGTGLELAASGSPLIARALPGRDSTTLFASSHIAGPQDYSGSWVSDHDIIVKNGTIISGSFVLRAISNN